MLVLLVTLLLILIYILQDILITGKLFFVKNITIGISNLICAFLIISEILFAFNKYSLFRTYLLCGIIPLTIILLQFILCRDKIERLKGSQYISIEFFAILFVGVLLTVNRFEFFGMGQDQGVYQTKAILLTEEINDNYYTIKENELLTNDIDKNSLNKFVKFQRAGLGIYALQDNANRGTISIDKEYPYTAIFHGISNFPALLSITGKIFGIEGIMYILPIFYLLSISLMYLICRINLGLSRITSDIITTIFTISPIILWVSKSALTEIVLTLIILLFIYVLTSKEEKDKKMLWFPVAAFSFTHVSIYTIIPMFVVIFAWLITQKRDKSYLISGIISILSYLAGLVAMGYSSPQYTFDNYGPLLKIIHGVPNATYIFPLAIIGTFVAILLLIGLYLFCKNKDISSITKEIFAKVILILMILGLLYILYKWFNNFYVGTINRSWNNYKSKDFINSIQNYTFSAFIFWSGIILVPINLIFIIIKGKNYSGHTIILMFMFVYCIVIYSAFLRLKIPYYYYYSRYLAPFISIILILCALFIDKHYRAVIITGITSIIILLPFSLKLVFFDDASRIDFKSFININNIIIENESDKIIVIDNDLSPYFYYPLNSQEQINVFTKGLFTQLNDISFIKNEKVLFITREDLSDVNYPYMTCSYVSSYIGFSSDKSLSFSSKAKISDLLTHISESNKIYIYEIPPEQLQNLPISLSSFSSQNGILQNGRITSNGSAGVLLFGNYQELKPGKYKFSFEVSMTGNKLDLDQIGTLDVVSDRGKKELIKIPLSIEDLKGGTGTIELPFELTQDEEYVEGRIHVNEGVTLEVENAYELAETKSEEP